MPQPIVRPEDTVPRIAVRLVPIIHYQASCRDCGWCGVEWIERGDAEQDVITHRCRRPDDPLRRTAR